MAYFYLFVILFFGAINITEAAPKKNWIAAIHGLRMRSESNVNSKRLTTIPFGTEVTVTESDEKIETIDGVDGKWKKIAYNGKEGWVFDAYLRSYNFINLKEIASKFYREKMKRSYPSIENVSSLKKSREQRAQDIRIRKILGDYYLIDHWYSASTTPDDQIFKAVWYFRNGEWREIGSRNLEAYIVFLNNDKNPDILLYSGCCTSYRIEVILTNSSGIPELKSSGLFEGTLEIKPQGSCNSSNIIFRPVKGGQIKYSFDCNRNRFLNSSGKELTADVS